MSKLNIKMPTNMPKIAFRPNQSERDNANVIFLALGWSKEKINEHWAKLDALQNNELSEEELDQVMAGLPNI